MYLTRFDQIIAVGLMIMSPAAYCMCVSASASGPDDEAYVLQNTCSYAVNVKYTFSDSKPFSGTYTTLQANQSTFEQAKQTETARYYECAVPGVPQTLKGGCIGGKSKKGNYGEHAAKSSEEVENRKAAKEKEERDRVEAEEAAEAAKAAEVAAAAEAAATAEQQRQEADIAQLVNQAQRSGSLTPKIIPSGASKPAASMNTLMTQIQQMQQPAQSRQITPVKAPAPSTQKQELTPIYRGFCAEYESLASYKCKR